MFRYRIPVICLFVLLPLGTHIVYGQSQSAYTSAPINDILRFLEKSRHDIATFTQTKKFLTIQYDTLTLNIDRIKQAGDIGFFDRFELKSLLKESEDIAKQIVKIDNLIRAHGEANELQTAKLVEMMDKEIMDTLSVLSKRTAGHTISSDDSLLLNKMFAEKALFQVYRMKKFKMPLVEIKARHNDEAEELYQKADYLLDQSERLNEYRIDLDRMIDFIRRENGLKKFISRFVRLPDDESDVEAEFNITFPDSIVAFQRLPLSKNLVTPLDDYDTLIERLTVEKEAAEARIRLYTDNSDDIREIADYKHKIWEK